MNRKKRNQWRKWQATAMATLAVAALFQYVRSSDAFDVAYAAANGTDTDSLPASQSNTRDDVMDEWTGSFVPNQEEEHGDRSRSYGRNFGQSDGESDFGTGSGSYQSRTGAS
ncbi:hypothetical protein ABEW19_14760 [Paenibacillus illinoisensis]|uniref:hypothetical protein n=1 Tax=Paenibacillus illinoisensis TaxID=59845 RepID=UPI003D28067F